MTERPDPAEDSVHAPSTDERTVRARRRAVRGISLAMISLGLLLCASLSTTGRSLLGALGLLPAVMGAAGFLAVGMGVPAGLRLPAREHRRGRALWLLPSAVLALALVFLGAAFWADGTAPESGSPWTIVWLVSAATLITFAGLSFGLVAASRLTIHDDDDAPLRRVDWAEEYPERFEERPHRRPDDGYDSSWIRGQRR
ncbi:hypothetical protein [Kocuria palustris]|uniref:hypothetical protein n=1 Tax=Kocuria palustris TaxID=71999 RepID=UPI0006AA51F7|nr:hypothetical protein [Kocuria palustris]ALB03860.1 hypothetical protein KPaMU14_10910 [Kocuria palustris]